MNLWKMINLMIKDMLLQYSFFFFCCTGAWTQGLHLEPLHQPYFCEAFFETESLELFVWAGFECSLPDLFLQSS
jgi:hypothetical protein